MCLLRSQYESGVEKYVEKWEHFQKTYKDMPKARELTRRRETLNQIKDEGICATVCVCVCVCVCWLMWTGCAGVS